MADKFDGICPLCGQQWHPETANEVLWENHIITRQRARIAELERENNLMKHNWEVMERDRYNKALNDVLALPTVTLGPMGTKAIPIFRIEALLGLELER